MRRVVRMSGLVVIVLSACVAPAPAATPAQTWIAVEGPMGWRPEAMRLEIDGRAWSVTLGGGVVTPDLTESAEVRLVGLTDCRLFATFEAAPGSAHLIRFAVDGSVTVVDMAGQAQAMGPGLVEGDASRCDAASAE